jgi:uncharacterized membrane protein YbjE (DUF340 family)
MLRRLLLTLIAFLLACGFVGVAFANPIPVDPLGWFFGLDPLQYFQIVVAEFCALVVGTAMLVHWREMKWQKATALLGVALAVSYVLGIFVWTVGYRMGVLAFSPSDPSFSGLMYLLFPEFIGTTIGTVMIRLTQKILWVRALIVMTCAMLTSLVLGIVFAYLNLALRFA